MHTAWVTDASDRLRHARLVAGFDSAAEAARALGIDYPTYAGHENGSRGFHAQATRYAHRYGVSLDWLLSGRGPMRHDGHDPLVEDIKSLSPERRRELQDFLDFLKSRPV